MRDCLRDATLAPSSSNLEPYELYWVRDSTTREKLVEACLGQPAAATAGELIVVMARRDQWKANLDKVWDLMTTVERTRYRNQSTTITTRSHHGSAEPLVWDSTT